MDIRANRVLQLIILGISSVLLALVLQVSLSIIGGIIGLHDLLTISYQDSGPNLIFTFIIGALSEEIIRVGVLGLYILVVLRQSLDSLTTTQSASNINNTHRNNSLLYGLIFGLAFGLTETILFLTGDRFSLEGTNLAIIISLVGALGLHIALSVFTSWRVSRIQKKSQTKHRIKSFISILLIACATHIAYNTLVYFISA